MPTMAGEAGKRVNRLGSTSLMTDTDGWGQSQTERGRLVTVDQDGRVVWEVTGKHLLVAKARVDALVEVKRRTPW